MTQELFQRSVEEALRVLQNGGTILYPTDTIWGIGCDALNEEAVKNIYRIKEREDSKSMIILIAEEKQLFDYIAAPPPDVFDFMEEQERPTTVILPNAIGLPSNLVAADGSIGLRLVRDEFCRHLVKRLKRPLVSTSANISGSPSPQFFDEVSDIIRGRVDYIVPWRQDDSTLSKPSRILLWKSDGSHSVLRD